MKKRFTLSRLVLCGIALSLFCSKAAAQVYFGEDFEGAPIATITNNGDATLVLGASPCGKGSRGDVTIFNSTHVDFQALQNQTRYLAVNPESPCGGFYTANLHSDTVNLTAADSLVFSCRYFKSNTLGWGPTSLIITFDNGSATYTLNSEFTAVNTWTNFTIGLPASMQSSAVSMQIIMGGGEGVALDDIQIREFSGVGTEEVSDNLQWQLFPNPASDVLQVSGNSPIQQLALVDMSGRTLRTALSNASGTIILSVADLPAGVYLARAEDEQGHIRYQKLVIGR